MLKNVKWCAYHLYDLFYIYSGNKFDKSKMTMFDPNINFVGRSSKNNGVTAYVDYIEGVKPYPAGCMTIALGGEYIGSCFIQRHPFYTSQNVFVLSEKQTMSENVKLFISHLIRFESKNNYMAFARELNSHIKNDFIIKLPSVEEGKVDYDYIDKYVDSLDSEITSIPDYFLNEGYNKACWYLDNINQEDFERDYAGIAEANQCNLSDRKWIDFCLDDLFYITPGQYIPASEYAEGDVPYITSSAENNGIKQFISLEGRFKGNSITTGKIHCDAFYQEKSYCASSDANILVPKYDGFTKAMGLFIVSVINFSENSKWNYGRQCRMGDSKKIVIKLPAINEELPDYDFMEKYIKSLPFSARI